MYIYKTIGGQTDILFTITTPLACIPVNMLCMYLDEADFDVILKMTEATFCKIKVTPKGYRSQRRHICQCKSYGIIFQIEFWLANLQMLLNQELHGFQIFQLKISDFHYW